MKQTIKLASAIIALAASALTMVAQQHVEDAIAQFSSSDYAKQTKMLREADNDGTLSGMCEIYTFNLPQYKHQLLDNVFKAFDSDSDDAYYSLSEEANAKNRRTTALTYGDGGESVLVGSDKNTNYRVICFLDKQNGREDYRYGYVVEWTEDDNGDVNGRVISTYGKRPETSKGKSKVIRIDDIDLGELEKLGELDSVDWKKLGKEMKGVLGTVIRGGTEAVEALRNSGFDLKDILSSETLGALGDNIYVATGDVENEEFTDDVQWLTAFNHYRNAYMRAAQRKSTLVTSYATSVLKLCKKAQKIKLSDNEKKLCVKSLKEMKKKTKDSFVSGLLDEAIDALK